MRSFTSTLLFDVAVTVVFSKKSMAQRDDHRALANLAEKWSIADPVVLQNGLDFTFDYDVSNYVDAGQAYYEIYDSGCNEGGSIVSSGFTLSPLVDVTAGSVTDPALFNIAGKAAQVPIGIDANTIVGNTDVYTETGAGATLGASIVYCVRFGLNTLGETPIEVNFFESIVTLTVDLSSGFSIVDVNVTPKIQLLNTVAQAYTAEGYMCQPGTDLPVIDATTPLLQGSMITVCIKPNADGIADGVKMRTIDSFHWTRDATIQAVVESGTAAGNLLTTFDAAACAGGDYCQISTILFAAFYTSPGQVGGAGVASMQFGTRRLGGLRSLQERDIAATSGFDLSLSIESANDGPSAHQTAAGTTTGTMLAAIAGLIGAVALL
jgi:hypothetical protein